MSLRPVRLRSILLRSFVCCFLLAAALFLPFLIIDKGFFLYCGDFNSQQIPFTYYLEGLVKDGIPHYAWATDLGSGFVESYSFYLLGSPFFWLGSLLPQSWSPFLMVPLLCFKFAVAGMGAALWARRHTRTAYGAELAAVLYAFSGFSIYNIFFNHFVDVIAIFPFLLWSVDEFFEADRRGVFAVMVAVCLFVNYFFFVGQVVFVVLYFLVMLLGDRWQPKLRTFGLFCFEAVLGVGLAMVMALPSAYAVLRNPRVDNFSTGLDLLFYWRTQQYLAIFTSAFLPQDPSYMPNLFPDCSIKWTSMSLYLPFTGLAGVFVWMKTHKKHPMRRLLFICLVMAMVPVLNAAFYAFNASFYCRWYYLPLLVMAALTASAMEEAPQADWRRCTLLCGAITAAYLVFAILPAKDDDGNFQLGIEDDPLRFFLTLLLALGALAILYALLTHSRDRTALLRYATAFAAMFGVVIGIYTITCGKFPQRFGDADYKMECYDHRLELQQWLDDADKNYYRIDTYESYTNLGLWLNRSCLQFFNSTVDASILEFYPSVGVKRDVSSKPEQKNYALRGLLNTRYLLMPSDRMEEFFEKESYTGDWQLVKNIGPYAILEYRLFVPFGTTYEYYITTTQYEELAENNRSGLLLRALVLTDEQAAAYADRIQPLPTASLQVNNYGAYSEDCMARARAACDTFVTDEDGFSAAITLDAPRLLFFSIPYNEGWQVTVNGQPVPVERVDEGLCAIPVEAGTNEIRGEYRAPGLAAGRTVSLVCVAVLALYLPLCLWWARRRRAAMAAGTADAAYSANGAARYLTHAEEAAALSAWQPPEPPEAEEAEQVEEADATEIDTVAEGGDPTEDTENTAERGSPAEDTDAADPARPSARSQDPEKTLDQITGPTD